MTDKVVSVEYKFRRSTLMFVSLQKQDYSLSVKTFAKRTKQIGIIRGDQITYAVQKKFDTRFPDAYLLSVGDKSYFSLDEYNYARIKGIKAVKWLLVVLGLSFVFCLLSFVFSGFYNKFKGRDFL